MKIDFVGKNAMVSDSQSAFTFEVSETPRDFDTYRSPKDSLDWSDHHYNVAGWRIHPYGDDNDLPKQIQEAVASNSFAPGMLEKKTQILWGKGPKLYREEFQDGELVQVWVEDKDIQAWLNTWDYEDYLMRCCVDYAYMQGAFTKIFLNRGIRIGKPGKIAKLEHVSIDKSRLASVYETNTTKPTHVVVTDFTFDTVSSLTDMKVYKLFDFKNPFAEATTMHYSNMYSFCSNYYTVPNIYGSLEWLRRSTAIPLILKALSKNSINIKYHVISPQEFWNQAETRIKESCKNREVEYEDYMLEDYKKDLLKGVSKVLGSEANTGKFWHTTKSFEVDGTNLIEHGWEIKVIDQKIKDFVESQILMSKHAVQNLSAGIGLHSAIGNTSDSGKADSGSEQLYALQNYLLTGIDIPEMIVTKTLNYAIQANFPDKELKIGFYHIGVKKQEEVSPADRSNRQV